MIYTFYSYKGGVGRTMALANIAELFYQAGYSVLMVDWDLEAPGLERYFSISDLEQILEQPGLIDMLLQYKSQMTHENDADFSALLESPSRYAIDIYPPQNQKGKLRLLTSGKRTKNSFAQYVHAVQTFDWQEFYEEWEGELYFNWLRNEFEEMADIVLIDSRTGVTEMGGVCTYHLADVIVMFCAPNQQNLHGTEIMARNFTSPEVMTYRSERDLIVLTIPTRIDTAESDQLNEFRKQFFDLFGKFVPYQVGGLDIRQLWNVRIPYIAKYAYSEEVAVRQETAIAEYMFEAYSGLHDILLKLLSFKDVELSNSGNLPDNFDLYKDLNDDRIIDSQLRVSSQTSIQMLSQPYEAIDMNDHHIKWPPLWSSPRISNSFRIEEWVRMAHLKFNPFGPEHAEWDPQLLGYYVYPPVLKECLEGIRSDIIFGAAGSGKTACQFILTYMCRTPISRLEEANIFPVPCIIDTTREIAAAPEAGQNFVIENIARALIAFLTLNPLSFLTLESATKIAISACLYKAFSSMEQLKTQFTLAGLLNHRWGEHVLTELEDFVSRLEIHSFTQKDWIQIISTARPKKFSRTYIICELNNMDLTVLSRHTAYLQQIVDFIASPTVRKVYLKALFPDLFQSHLTIPEHVVNSTLAWTDELLEQMLRQRIRAEDKSKIHFEQLFDIETRTANPARLLAEAANGSPQRLIRLGNRLLAQHVTHQPTRIEISYQDLAKTMQDMVTDSY